MQEERDSELQQLRTEHAQTRAQLLEATASAEMHAATEAHVKQLQDTLQHVREEVESARKDAAAAQKRAAMAERAERLEVELGEAQAFASSEAVSSA